MIVARAPASTANLGPAFDAGAAALDLWNTVEIDKGPFSVDVSGEGADEVPRDGSHLSLRAFALFAGPEQFRFRFANAIPLERGLGSSAAAIALGLVAGAHAAGRAVSADKLLSQGEQFEGHIDNLAATIHGGVCVAWHDTGAHARRIADGMPAAAGAVVPAERTSTAGSRTALPEAVAHADAAVNAGAAMLLGAAVASGDPELLGHAFRDRLHERYRAAGAPLLEQVRALTPDALGVTLSGSGPTVIAWVAPADRDHVAASLIGALSGTATVVALDVARDGAGVTPRRPPA